MMAAVADPLPVDMQMAGPRVLLVDPVLFTAPYDAALTQGLGACGVVAHWATRALRPDEEPELPPAQVTALFYRMSDGPRRPTTAALLNRLVKGVEHAIGLEALVRLARRGGFDLVHFQWSVLPQLDGKAMARIRAERPVVLTVHDLVPFNGKNVSRLQRSGFSTLLRSVDHLIVHTDGARRTLIDDGIAPDRVSVIPHGMLPLRAAPDVTPKRGGRWQIVMFGRLQSYKGLDVLVEAAGRLAPAVRGRIEIVVAGEPMVPLDALRGRVAELCLEPVFRFEPRRFDEREMAALLTGADCFVFPYRAIEASGVLHLVAHLGKWIVASDLGAFRGMIGADGRHGRLTPPGDVEALARALADSIGRAPAGPLGEDVPDWAAIGAMTRDVYEAAIARHARGAEIAA